MPYLGKRALPQSGEPLENVGYNALSPHSDQLTAAEGELTYSGRKKRNEMRFATWNVRTLNESPRHVGHFFNMATIQKNVTLLHSTALAMNAVRM